MDTNVTIYSADWCAFCHAAKDYLDKLGVKYTEKNVEEDVENAKEAVEKSDQMGIPVIDIAGQIIVGFDRPKIDAALKEHKLV
jgi:glutaredoxin-like YruB-family protein